jgi:hypothetical protein
MKARFTDEQIIAMIKEQEAGEKTADLRSSPRRPAGGANGAVTFIMSRW